MKVRSRLDSGLTAAILGFFAMGWFSWGRAEASGALSVALIVGFGAALVVAVLGVFRTCGSRRTEGTPDDAPDQRRYGILVGIEFAVAGLGAVALGAVGAAAFIPVSVCAVVGLHLFPLAPILDDPALRGLGAVVVGVAGAALLVGVLTGVAPGSVTGAGAGLALLAFGTQALAGHARKYAAT